MPYVFDSIRYIEKQCTTQQLLTEETHWQDQGGY